MTHFPNEHYLEQTDGKEEKRITDSSFTILSGDLTVEESAASPLAGERIGIRDGPKEKHYLYECESKPVSDRILIRFFEYVTQVGLDQGRYTDAGTLHISIPQSAILSLRSTKNTPNTLEIVIETEQGELGTTVPVVKLSDYTIDEIFAKKLYFYIPFLLFQYENHFSEIEGNPEKRKRFLEEIRRVYQRLDALIPENECTFGLVDLYTSKTLRAMTHTVVEGLAAKYPKIREGVNQVVGGNIMISPPKLHEWMRLAR